MKTNEDLDKKEAERQEAKRKADMKKKWEEEAKVNEDLDNKEAERKAQVAKEEADRKAEIKKKWEEESKAQKEAKEANATLEQQPDHKANEDMNKTGEEHKEEEPKK